MNPEIKKIKDSDLDLVVAGTKQGVLMVESEAKELSEDVMLGAVDFGHKSFQPVIDMIISLAEECAKDAWELPALPAEYDQVKETLAKECTEELKAAFTIHNKLERQAAVGAVKEKALALFAEDEVCLPMVEPIFHDMEAQIVRQGVLTTGMRIDGRDTKTVRPIEAEVGLLPRAHGSALFTRGETQALVVATLGTGEDEQIVDECSPYNPAKPIVDVYKDKDVKIFCRMLYSSTAAAVPLP